MKRARKRNHPESAIQRGIVQWAQLQQKQYPPLKLLYHPPNGGKRNKTEAAIFKGLGVLAGVWDLHLPWPVVGPHNGGLAIRHPGLWIEVKAPGGKLTKAQQSWGGLMHDAGCKTEIALSVDRGIEALREYLELWPNINQDAQGRPLIELQPRLEASNYLQGKTVFMQRGQCAQ